MSNTLSLVMSLVMATVFVGVPWMLWKGLVGEHPRVLPGETSDENAVPHQLFHPKKGGKRKAAGLAQPAVYNRPAEIEVPADAVLPPPRPIEGQNGE